MRPTLAVLVASVLAADCTPVPADTAPIGEAIFPLTARCHHDTERWELAAVLQHEEPPDALTSVWSGHLGDETHTVRLREAGAGEGLYATEIVISASEEAADGATLYACSDSPDISWELPE